MYRIKLTAVSGDGPTNFPSDEVEQHEQTGSQSAFSAVSSSHISHDLGYSVIPGSNAFVGLNQVSWLLSVS